VNSLGAQTAKFLAVGRPAQLLLLGRTESKITPVINVIKEVSPDTAVHFVQIDLSKFDSIRKAAAEVNSLVTKIDVLINNAGIMALKDFTPTTEGLESQFGANHIGHFLLTNLLAPKLIAANDSRIVNLSSDGFALSQMQLDNYNFDDGKTYDKWKAYGQSKTANQLFTVSLASKLGSKGVLAFSVHPGKIKTNLGTDVDPSEWPKVKAMFEAAGMFLGLHGYTLLTCHRFRGKLCGALQKYRAGDLDSSSSSLGSLFEE
jgi:NAD(P)-dependent dehydrogenase (short-subunit alcohol dehydrogenase family)